MWNGTLNLNKSISSWVNHRLCLCGPTERLVTKTIWLVLVNATRRLGLMMVSTSTASSRESTMLLRSITGQRSWSNNYASPHKPSSTHTDTQTPYECCCAGWTRERNRAGVSSPHHDHRHLLKFKFVKSYLTSIILLKSSLIGTQKCLISSSFFT